VTRSLETWLVCERLICERHDSFIIDVTNSVETWLVRYKCDSCIDNVTHSWKTRLVHSSHDNQDATFKTYGQSHLGWHFRKLKAQSSNVSFATFQWKETLELWALSFERAFENVTPSGIGCSIRDRTLQTLRWRHDVFNQDMTHPLETWLIHSDMTHSLET